MFNLIALVCDVFRQKTVCLSNHPSGPYRCADETDLCTTPDDECCTLDELLQKSVLEHADQFAFGQLGP